MAAIIASAIAALLAVGGNPLPLFWLAACQTPLKPPIYRIEGAGTLIALSHVRKQVSR